MFPVATKERKENFMSVLKARRSESKAEFVNTANKIYIQTINFLSRLSARYSRLMSTSVADLASAEKDLNFRSVSFAMIFTSTSEDTEERAILFFLISSNFFQPFLTKWFLNATKNFY